MGKVVQEDGRVLLIAVLEVRWSKWGGWGWLTLTAEAAALLGTLCLCSLSFLILFLHQFSD